MGKIEGAILRNTVPKTTHIKGLEWNLTHSEHWSAWLGVVSDLVGKEREKEARTEWASLFSHYFLDYPISNMWEPWLIHGWERNDELRAWLLFWTLPGVNSQQSITRERERRGAPGASQRGC